LEQGHPGKRFEDFLVQRMRGKTPVRVQLDATGRAVIKLTQGKWWLRASSTSADNESAEWRLPVSVIGSKQTIELTKENVYERTKKF